MTGALILLSVALIVAITIPILDKNNRNSERRRDIDLVASLITSWQEDNQGSLPDSSQVSTIEGLKGLTDPDGSSYSYLVNSQSSEAGSTVSSLKSSATLDHRVYIFYSATCAGNYVVTSANDHSFAVIYKLEGTNSFYCACN